MVYVDPEMTCLPNEKYRWNKVTHLFADTEEELHTFAQAMGMKREWFQRSNRGLGHYDLNNSRRKVAVGLGVKQLTREEAVKIWHQQTKPAGGMASRLRKSFVAAPEEVKLEMRNNGPLPPGLKMIGRTLFGICKCKNRRGVAHGCVAFEIPVKKVLMLLGLVGWDVSARPVCPDCVKGKMKKDVSFSQRMGNTSPVRNTTKTKATK